MGPYQHDNPPVKQTHTDEVMLPIFSTPVLHIERGACKNFKRIGKI